MSVKYKLYQDNRKSSKTRGKFYARAVVSDVADLETISKEIEENTSAKQADVYAVLRELVNVMARHMRNGDRVVLDGFGSFKVGLKTKPAETAEKFNAAVNIVGTRVNFQPETHWKAGDPARTRAFLSGIEVRPYEPKPGEKGGTQPKPDTEENP
ncbi:HU family DNA-binding protein [Prevotella sp. HUN102]|uniref:HU family DNA-binding protein n=1 Tax=Prevotella sp. HUN102 TaxID=1392486 RepID=UPI00048BE1B4|nr:HU family DNA-binding protein [Prevotella sp. HUN102]